MNRNLGLTTSMLNHMSNQDNFDNILNVFVCNCSYQSAPFFVLDEIDAALDNTNIGKVKCLLSHRILFTF